MQPERILTIAERVFTGRCVVYLMSRDQRVSDNHALIAAQEKALALNLPLVVVFNMMAPVGVRAYEHAQFMLEGLEQVALSLKRVNIPFVMTTDRPGNRLKEVLDVLTPAALYTDFSPLAPARKRITLLATQIPCSVYVVDTHNIIPAWIASDKEEFAAHTFRRKVHRHLAQYLVPPPALQVHPFTFNDMIPSVTFLEASDIITAYPRRGITIAAHPGEDAGHQTLQTFITEGLEHYAQQRNNIAIDAQSHLSPYLHFGQLSSLRVALDVLASVKTPPLLFEEAKMPSASNEPSVVDGMNALFEEMIVRKELSDNFCLYSADYLSLNGAPDWARRTLTDHLDDPREWHYDRDELEAAQTHDQVWNAAQRELTQSGKIHGYLRMYWAKKLLEWSDHPEEALAHAQYLNDAYSIDGGDPNGYVGILWAIAGLHDRPWGERPIFGKIRYMNEAGLRRKFHVDDYLERIG